MSKNGSDAGLYLRGKLLNISEEDKSTTAHVLVGGSNIMQVRGWLKKDKAPSVAQEYLRSFAGHVGEQVEIRVVGRGYVPGKPEVTVISVLDAFGVRV